MAERRIGTILGMEFYVNAKESRVGMRAPDTHALSLREGDVRAACQALLKGYRLAGRAERTDLAKLDRSQDYTTHIWADGLVYIQTVPPPGGRSKPGPVYEFNTEEIPLLVETLLVGLGILRGEIKLEEKAEKKETAA
jgi:hypothetical protein